VRGAADPDDLTLPLYSATALVSLRRLVRGSFRFKGRASQSEFWWGYLWWLLAYLVVIGVFIVVVVAAAVSATDNDAAGIGVAVVYLVLGSLSYVLLVPLFALGWRRLQDANLHGALVLLSLAASIWLIVIGFLPTSPEGQRFDQTSPGPPAPFPGQPPGQPRPY